MYWKFQMTINKIGLCDDSLYTLLNMYINIGIGFFATRNDIKTEFDVSSEDETSNPVFIFRVLKGIIYYYWQR